MEAELEKRLQAAATALRGDWSDVVERADRLGSRSRRRRRLLLAFAALALIGCGSALAIGTHVFGWFSVSESSRRVPSRIVAEVAFVKGNRLHVPGRPDQVLAAPLLAPLLGTDATLVVGSPTGRYVAYHAWQRQTPLLRIHDTHTGHDVLLARGAETLAWAADGHVAYFQATRARYTERAAYIGNIVVRRSFTSRSRTWTRRAGAYEVIAWAGKQLLVSVRRCVLVECADDPPPGVYTLNQAGQFRALPLSSFSALSPNGRYVIGGVLSSPGADSPSSLVRVVDLIQGRTVTTIDLTKSARAAGLSSAPFTNGIQRGVWRGNEIVATSSARQSALTFLRMTRSRLQLVDVIRIPPKTLPVRYGVYFGVPAFVGNRSRQVVVRISGEREAGIGVTAIISCDREARSCVRGAPLAEREWFATVENPSRPGPRRAG
jgi:hypothetical protein